jgi:hypothetical protein
MVDIGNREYQKAILHLTEYRAGASDTVRRTLAAVWIGLINEVLGKNAERDQAWKGIDWKNKLFRSERSAGRGILGLDEESQVTLLSSDFKNPQLARNQLLMAGVLERLSHEEKVRLLEALTIHKRTQSEIEKERGNSYDDLELLAAGRCCLSISRALKDKVRATVQGQSASKIRFDVAHIDFLLGDYGKIIDQLRSDGDILSQIIVGAANFRLGNHEKAVAIWSGAEQKGDGRAHSWIGYFYALSGYNLERGAQLSSEGLESEPNLGQQPFLRHARVLDLLGRHRSAREAYSQGYNHDRRTSFSSDTNDPEYAVRFCAEAQRVDGTYMDFVNQLLLQLSKQYRFLGQLHWESVLINSCRDM